MNRQIDFRGWNRKDIFSSFGSVADLKEVEVIGNVYQNKKLLEE